MKKPSAEGFFISWVKFHVGKIPVAFLPAGIYFKETDRSRFTYWEMGEFWDTHDLTDYWDKTRPVEFDVAIESEVTYYAIDRKLSDALQQRSTQRGVSPETLLNLWVQEKLKQDGNKSGNTEKRHARGKKMILQY